MFSQGGARWAPRFSQELAEIGRGLAGADVEAGLGADLERRPRGVHAPLAAQARFELAAHDGHPLGGVGVEVVLAGEDHAARHAPAVAREAEALDLAVEV